MAAADHPTAADAALVPAGLLLSTHSPAHRHVGHLDGCVEEPHSHGEHTLFWPERGFSEVRTRDQLWNLTVGQGLWVPAGTEHSVNRRSSTTPAAMYIRPTAWRRAVGPVRTVVVNTALRELLAHLDWTPMPRAQRLRAQEVCLELITDGSRPTITVPLPHDQRIAEIARQIMADPADNHSIDDWAYRTSQSSRTIARAFRAETGLTFTQWRTHARMARAVELLGEDLPVGVVARRVGYNTSSAFTAAFRRLLNQPPSEFVPGRAP